MNDRIEHDTLGDVRVPADRRWGAQTQRSKLKFSIGGQRMPSEVIHALAIVKKAATLTNRDAGLLSAQTCALIGDVCDEIVAGGLHDEFPLVVWQTGSYRLIVEHTLPRVQGLRDTLLRKSEQFA